MKSFVEFISKNQKPILYGIVGFEGICFLGMAYLEGKKNGYTEATNYFRAAVNQEIIKINKEKETKEKSKNGYRTF